MKIRSTRSRQERKAFSLLELVAVVTLIGIVAAVTMVRLNNVNQAGAQANVDQQNVALIQTAVERFNFDNGSMPANVAALVTAGYLARAPESPSGGTYAIAANGTVSISGD